MNEDILTDLIIKHEKLIRKIASQYAYYHNPDDLFQVGAIGLRKALENFDETKDVKFTTFAYSHILGEIKKYVREDRVIKISRELYYLNGKIEKAKEWLEQDLMRTPTTEELAFFLEVKKQDIENAGIHNTPITSLDKETNSEEKQTNRYELIDNCKAKNVDQLIDLKNAIEKLDDEEKRFIEARYTEELSQSETGKIFDMNQVKASREEQKILQKLYKEVA